MCGRFTLEPTAKFYERFELVNKLEHLIPRYNIAPGQQVPAVIKQSPNQAVWMKWGLIPHWAKDPKIGYKMINARAETIGEKPVFKSLLTSRRCLVPSSGFYEWQAGKNGKTPYFIHLKDQELFSFAGLYDIWKNEKGDDVHTFTIITTSPNEFMQTIHNRMPVILEKEQEDVWLDKEITDPAKLLPLLHPYRVSAMDAHPISKAVNKPENDYIELLEEAAHVFPKAE